MFFLIVYQMGMIAASIGGELLVSISDKTQSPI